MNEKDMTLGEKLSYEQGYRDGVEMGILVSIIAAFFMVLFFTSL